MKILGQETVLPTKSLALLGYLLGTHDGNGKRTVLADLLWPGSKSGSALHSLSQALYVVKRELGPEAVKASLDTLSVGSVESDVDDFRRAVAARDWARAAELYIGAFMEDFSINGCAEFEHWLDMARTDFAGIAEEVLVELIAERSWETARRLSTTLRKRDPHNLGVARGHVRALYHLREIQGIESLIKQCPSYVAEELRDEYERLGHEVTNPSRGPFVGREEAMEWLSLRLKRCKRGATVVALIDGEVGIGKTALADRFARLATLRGAKVLSALAYPAEQNVPFGVVAQLLQGLNDRDVKKLSGRPWLRVIREAFAVGVDALGPDVAEAVGEVGHHRLVESLRHLFVHLAEVRPLILAIDDLDVADAASIAFLHFMVRRSQEQRLLILGTMRVDKDSRIDPIRDWTASEVHTLQGLVAEEIRDWLSQTGVIPQRDWDHHVGRLIERTGGNPLLLSTLMEDPLDDPWDSKHPPQTIVDFYRPRLERTSAAAKTFLYALAVVGEPTPASVVEEIADTRFSDTEAAIRELVNESLITCTEGMVALRHGLLGEVATSSLSDIERQRLHGRAARVLTGKGRPSDAFVAISLDIAGKKADAFRAAMRACEACDVLQARSEKEFFLKLALSNATTEMDKAHVRMELAEAYRIQKKPKEGIAVLDAVDEEDLPLPVRREVEATRLRVLTEMTGDVETLVDLWAKATTLRPELAPLAFVDTSSQMASVAHDLGADALALEISERAVAEVSRLPLTVDVAQRLLRPTAMIGMKRGYDVALRRLDAMPKPVEGDPVYASAYHETKGALQVAAGRLLQAETSFSESLGIAERYALFDRYYAISNNLGVCLMEQGRYEEAEDFYRSAMEYTSEEVGPAHHSISRDNLTILLYETGQLERAVKLAQEAMLRGGNLSGRELISLHGIIGLCSLELGDLTRCRQAERELDLLFQAQEPYSNDMSYVQIFLARMLAMRRETDQALDDLESAGHSYQGLNKPARLRIEIERFRLLITRGSNCKSAILGVLNELQGTGAIPLLERAGDLLSRAERQFG